MQLSPLSSVFMALSLIVISLRSFVTAASLNAMTNKGCYSSAPGLVNQGSYDFQSSGYCQKQCVEKNKPVMALKDGDKCYCGDLLPPSSSSAGNSDCSSPCAGYDQDNCGGPSAYQIALTGISSNVGTASGGGGGGGSSDDSHESDNDGGDSGNRRPALKSLQEVTISPKTITVGGSTLVQTHAVSTVTVAVSQGAENKVPTPTPTAAQSAKSHDEGTPTGTKVGIAVGVVAGVLALAAVVFAVYFFLKRKRSDSGPSTRPRRTTSIGSFAAAGTLPADSNHGNRNIGSSDSRLDHKMMDHRRLSDGSIFADNQDYSRRILKVANPNPDDRDSMIR